MILHIYGLKNRLSGIFEKPVTELHDEKEYCELLTQSLAMADPVVLARHKEYDVYHLGTIETKTGEIAASGVEFVMSLEQVCEQYILAKEGANNGREGSKVSA